MTAPTPAESSGNFVLGLLLGLAGSCLLGLLISAPVGYGLAQASRNSEKNRGWNLVPVVVYAVDVAPGTIVTFDMISQRSIPQQFTDASMFRPDNASFLVNQPLGIGVRAGDPAREIDLVPAAALDCFAKPSPPP
ncbi:MAG: Flp pilus assembly protein CpaB [Myxococcaceae bacterium]|nr:Flp pilus assembly protein CpaB [Myxococcaceae bacterium]